MSELSKFQQEVGEWGDETFNRTKGCDYLFITGRIMHLTKEVKELKQGCLSDIPEESVDCFLLLLHIAHIYGFDLLAAAKDKMEINRKRKWGEPDKDGVIEHV